MGVEIMGESGTETFSRIINVAGQVNQEEK
jgi:hypothetical protein